MPNMIWKYIRSSKQYQYPITDEFQPLTVTVKYNDVITSLSGYHMFLNDVIGSDARHSKFLIVQHLFFRRKLVAGSVEWYHFRLCIQLMRKFTMQTSIEKNVKVLTLYSTDLSARRPFKLVRHKFSVLARSRSGERAFSFKKVNLPELLS